MTNLNSKELFVVFAVNNFHEVDLVSVGTKNEAIIALEADASEVTIWNGPEGSAIFTEPKKTEFGYSYLVAINNGHISKGLFMDIEGKYHKRIDSFKSSNQ